MMKTFSIGGIHPSDKKISKDCKIEVLPVPSKVFISVAQHPLEGIVIAVCSNEEIDNFRIKCIQEGRKI